MAQPSARPEFSNLTLRILSAAVLLPLVVVVVWFGSWYFLTFVVLIGAAMGLEYSKLCGAGAIARGIITGALATLPVMLFLAGPFAGLAWGAVCAILLMFYILIRPSSDGVLLLIGTVYLSLGILAISWLRLVPEDGALTVFWIFAVVVGTDVGAYFAGRGIGGPKLAPRISPSKTWAGLGGGMICAAAAGWSVVAFGAENGSVNIALASGGFAVIAQIGDLLESALKRHCGVKDSGTLIPGHGGVLDRLDGYLSVAPVVVLLAIVSGESPLVW